MDNAVMLAPRVGDRPRPKKNYLNETKGFWSWAGTLDHKRIGIMYLVGVLFAFFLGGMFCDPYLVFVVGRRTGQIFAT